MSEHRSKGLLVRDRRNQGPTPITDAERTARLRRIRTIARRLGFIGRLEYRHVFSGTGGAQFGLGSSPNLDLIVVFAEAFVRDSSPDDFSLQAIIAHELGHQFVLRKAQLQRFLAGRQSQVTEEILASLVGSIIVNAKSDRESLVLKALDDAVQCGLSIAKAVDLVSDLRQLLRDIE